MEFLPNDGLSVRKLAEEYARTMYRERAAIVNRMMQWLLAVEWLGLMVAALTVSPRVWNGASSSLHPHVWAAILAGPAFILPAIAIAYLYPESRATRHALAIAQMFVSILLIDCTGGRIETHFHVFGSLALLAFYMDWQVLLTATLITAVDHFVRGVWWPQSVYGVLTVSPWRWLEHAGWVLFEDVFLVIAARQGVRDVRTMALAKARLYEGASYDVLTGVANRRTLQERFDTWVDANPAGTSAVLFIDLDRFKQANDTLGHTVGDKLLSLVAARLAAVVGAAGLLARIGGDEFVVFFSGASGLEAATALGQALVASLRSPFHVGKHELLLSASAGVSLYPDHGTSLAALQERADRAMYVAKSQGRNRCVAFSSEVSRREGTMKEIARDLHGALGNEQFYLHYQPLMQRDGSLAGFEALVRWEHPQQGTIAPSEFIPLAESTGLIGSLGDWVLAEACRKCLTWQRPGHPVLGVAVNVSAMQFCEADYPDRVFATLSETGLNPALLTLELTESVLARNTERARAHLLRLRLAGILVALDDFGTGYSSLSYLAELPADLIKLDRSFLNSQLPESNAIIESVVSLAHRLGMRVVAEGVETLAQNEVLLDLKCDEFQGFYFSTPLSASAVSEMLDKRNSLAEPSCVTESLADLSRACALTETVPTATH
jgi:diguanylate cyclase (GGDEF)-like protein